jgi:hypothetical protein
MTKEVSYHEARESQKNALLNQYKHAEYVIKQSLSNASVAYSPKLLESLVISIAFSQEMNLPLSLETDLALKDWIYSFTSFIEDYWGMVTSQKGVAETEQTIPRTDIYWDIKAGKVKHSLARWADLSENEKIFLFERVRNAGHEWGFLVERFYNLEEGESLEFMDHLSYLIETSQTKRK